MTETDAVRTRGPCRAGDPDAEAVARMLAGDAAARELDAKYRAGLVEHAESILHDRARAEAVAQDSLADAFTRVGTFSGSSTFFTWLYGIYKYRLLKESKAAAARDAREVAADEPAGSSAAGAGGRQRYEDDWVSAIERAVTIGRQHTPETDHDVRAQLVAVVADVRRALPPATREVFYMLLSGMSNAEIARVTGTTEANVRGHLRRGRQVLRKLRDGREQDS
jgi:RNA polymerase sigma factor (sigma-70 family)